MEKITAALYRFAGVWCARKLMVLTSIHTLTKCGIFSKLGERKNNLVPPSPTLSSLWSQNAISRMQHTYELILLSTLMMNYGCNPEDNLMEVGLPWCGSSKCSQGCVVKRGIEWMSRRVYRVSHKKQTNKQTNKQKRNHWMDAYFKNKRNLEQIMSIPNLVIDLPFQWWEKEWDDWRCMRQCRQKCFYAIRLK